MATKTNWDKVDAATEEEINRQALEDDTLLDDEQLSAMKPVNEIPELAALTKRGRPRKANPKQSTTLRLDAEILDFFKGHGKGWQTEINAVLHRYVEEHKADQ